MIDIIRNRISNQKIVLIAEIGVNYYDIAKEQNISNIEAAKLMIKEAADAGVHAVKFQSYKADTLASKDSPYYWDIKEEPTKSQYELFKRFDSFGYDEYLELSKYAEECNVEFMSTPFDIESADYLNDIMNVYKISSSDVNNLGFIEYIAKKKKLILLSVGASDEKEIDRAVSVIKMHNDINPVLLHCVLEYPTPMEHAHINRIKALQFRYEDLEIGYSDHTKPEREYKVLCAAYCIGARIFEKHFTLNKNLKGNDHYHAMDPTDVKAILRRFDELDQILGNVDNDYLDSEIVARQNARRSLVAACDIKEGTIISSGILTWKRPGTGISADKIDTVIGKEAACDIPEDTVLSEDMIKW